MRFTAQQAHKRTIQARKKDEEVEGERRRRDARKRTAVIDQYVEKHLGAALDEVYGQIHDTANTGADELIHTLLLGDRDAEAAEALVQAVKTNLISQGFRCRALGLGQLLIRWHY